MIAFEPHVGRSSKNSERVSASVREWRSPLRGRAPMRSTRSSIEPFRVWMSSTTITSGSRRRHGVDEREEPRVHVMDERGLVVPLRDAEQQPQTVGDAIDLMRPHMTAGFFPEALPDLLGRVAVVDLCEVGDHRSEGRERGGLGVGPRAGDQHRHVFVQAGDQLVGQAGFPDAGLPRDGHQGGFPRGGRMGEASAQDRQLARATDERDRAACGPRGEALDRVRREVERESLGTDVPSFSERDL